MKRLHRFVLRMYLGPMFMTFFIVMFVLLMQFLWKYIDDLVGKGLEPHLILELLLYASAGLMPMAFPLATLLASLMTMGNLGEHNELLAMKSSGVSLPRIMLPIFLVACLVTGFAFFSADRIVPVATLKMRTMIYSVQRQRPDLVIKPGVFHSNISGYSMRVGAKDRGTNLMHDITIYDHSAGKGNTSVSKADSGYIHITPDQRYMIIQLYNGVMYTEDDPNVFHSPEPKYTARVTHFARQEVINRLEGFGFNRRDESLFSDSYHVMSTAQLSQTSDSLRYVVDSLQEMQHIYARDGTVLLEAPSLPDTVQPPREALLFNYRQEMAQRSELQRKRVYTDVLSRIQRLKRSNDDHYSDQLWRLESLARYEIELQRKVATSLACLLFMLIGAPLGAIIRKGGLGVPVVTSVLFFVVYYVLSLIGEKMARQLIITPVLGMWAPTFILLPVAAFLIYKATTESRLFNADSYRIVIQMIVSAVRGVQPKLRRGRRKSKVEGGV